MYCTCWLFVSWFGSWSVNGYLGSCSAERLKVKVWIAGNWICPIGTVWGSAKEKVGGGSKCGDGGGSGSFRW